MDFLLPFHTQASLLASLDQVLLNRTIDSISGTCTCSRDFLIVIYMKQSHII